jgi:hypothetical protein
MNYSEDYASWTVIDISGIMLDSVNIKPPSWEGLSMRMDDGGPPLTERQVGLLEQIESDFWGSNSETDVQLATGLNTFNPNHLRRPNRMREFLRRNALDIYKGGVTLILAGVAVAAYLHAHTPDDGNSRPQTDTAVESVLDDPGGLRMLGICRAELKAEAAWDSASADKMDGLQPEMGTVLRATSDRYSRAATIAPTDCSLPLDPSSAAARTITVTIGSQSAIVHSVDVTPFSVETGCQDINEARFAGSAPDSLQPTRVRILEQMMSDAGVACPLSPGPTN